MSKTKKTTNTSKTTTSTKVTPVNNNSKTKKTTTSNDAVSIKNLTDAYNYGIKQQTSKKMPPTHSAYHQLGKKRGSYSTNIWVIEASKDGKKWTPSDDSFMFYKSRDEGRDDLMNMRADDDSVFRYRLSKYIFAAASQS